MGKRQLEPTPSRSSRLLDEMLHDEDFRSKLSSIDRAALWRYRRGERTPDIKRAQQIAEASDGKIPLDGWLTTEKPKTRKRAA